jgi:hypothetical protein
MTYQKVEFDERRLSDQFTRNQFSREFAVRIEF